MGKNEQTSDQSFYLLKPQSVVGNISEKIPARELLAGDLCPACKEAQMDYDGLLNLVCPNCGYTQGGCFT
jgi:uncharacterized Zn finger protein (UPF0148 family)